MRHIVQKKRTKRSAPPLEGMTRNHVNQVDEMEKFSEDDGSHRDDKPMNDGIDYMINPDHNANAHTNKHGNQQKPQLDATNEKEYRNYAFDTTDTDKFNEDDDLLQRYYNRPVRRTADNEYDSFSDIMRLVASEGDRDDPFVKRLHYGNDNSFLNEEGNDENDNDNDIDKFNSEYDEYDEY